MSEIKKIDCDSNEVKRICRENALKKLHKEMNKENLWEAMLAFEGYPFYTAKKLQFFYQIKGNEMFVDRKAKSITRATVEVGFLKAMELGNVATGPKKLGCFGASYLYPIFIELGVIRRETK